MIDFIIIVSPVFSALSNHGNHVGHDQLMTPDTAQLVEPDSMPNQCPNGLLTNTTSCPGLVSVWNQSKCKTRE